jgi:hypothetical protein
MGVAHEFYKDDTGSVDFSQSTAEALNFESAQDHSDRL